MYLAYTKILSYGGGGAGDREVIFLHISHYIYVYIFNK